VVDCLKGDWHVIAPDWRGFGLSQRSGDDTYWFPDYLADLEAILDHYAPGEAVNLLGHSMGGNVVSLYAGARPARIRRLVNLEGFGLMEMPAKLAPRRYAKWLDGLREPAALRSYPDLGAVAQRLRKTNPRLPAERADFLAQHWAQRNGAGEWEVLGDPVHKQPSPLLYHVDDMLACWAAITAPVLWVEGADTNMWDWLGPKSEAQGELERRRSFLRQVQAHVLPDAGHMLHHDQPERLAGLIEAFLA
jgi:pimeloyl-ACP methyl ester carboxylesterase